MKKYDSPKRSNRGCLCKGKKKYSIKCCDGSLYAQGIGKTRAIPNSEQEGGG